MYFCKTDFMFCKKERSGQQQTCTYETPASHFKWLQVEVMSKISLFSVWFGMGQYDLNTSYVGESKKRQGLL